jgi:hypothetical protein
MGEELYSDIDYAKSVIKDKHSANIKFSKYSLIYPFTTENLSGYFDQINFKDRKVLTVTASGDHALNAILYGAKEVCTFDINRFTKYYLALKKAAILYLDYAAYICFFSGMSDLYLDKHIYKMIRNGVDDSSKIFWDSLFDEYNINDISYALLRNKYTDIEELRKFNPYLIEDKFLKLKMKIEKFDFSFMESNILNLSEYLNDLKFDLILLSNINDYIYQLYNNEYLSEYKKLIFDLSNNLNKHGKVAFAYIYRILEYSPYHEYDGKDAKYPFYNKRNREELLHNHSFNIYYFDSAYHDYAKDAVMTYTKKS